MNTQEKLSAFVEVYEEIENHMGDTKWYISGITDKKKGVKIKYIEPHEFFPSEYNNDLTDTNLAEVYFPVYKDLFIKVCYETEV